ncbi:MAG TPA: caspase family protein [Saprospiraceae bacterium]|nr:caspase family protein [Saprospiraceae bacterium]
MERGQGFTPPPQSARLPDGNYYFLCIGIDAYENVRQLNNARADAQALQELLLANYQFKPDHLITLSDEQATRHNIYQSLEELSQKVQENDSLLIYFAGHGQYNETWNQGFWIPVEGEADAYDTNIPFSFLKSQIEAINSFHTLVMADACHAGAMFETRDLKAEEEALARLDRIPSRFLLTSGRNEVVPDGPPGTHSPFAENLLFFLRSNPDELMSVMDLSRDLIQAVAVGNNPIPRAEPLPVKGHLGGEFIFRKKSYQFKAGAALPPRRAYAYREVEPNTDPMLGEDKKVDPLIFNEEIDTFENVKAVQKALRTYINADDLQGACALFERVLDEDSSILMSIYMQMARLNKNDKDARLGLASREQLLVTRNRIRFALIEYTKELDPFELRAGILQH